jgi:hypothetical protein
VVEEAPDHLDAALAKEGEAVVGPSEVETVGPVGRDRFPKDRESYRRQPEIGHEVDVAAPVPVAGFRCLIPIRVVEADNGGFGASP